jgi:hypothetical protein
VFDCGGVQRSERLAFFATRVYLKHGLTRMLGRVRSCMPNLSGTPGDLQWTANQRVAERPKGRTWAAVAATEWRCFNGARAGVNLIRTVLNAVSSRAA